MLGTPVPRPFDVADPSRYPAVIGCDEAGRGPLCGPVVAAACWFDPCALPHWLLADLDDSKRLSPQKRVLLATAIRAHTHVAVSARSAAEIDRTNIRSASLMAMQGAVAKLKISAPVVVDGRDPLPNIPSTARVGGDRLVPQIAAASIIAKTLRDALMVRLAKRHPGYGLDRHAGYPTAAHLEALRALGATAHHRGSFRPVATIGAGPRVRPTRR